jgi:GT2 family glycosyltransferase
MILCDLVLLSWNHLEETKPCLESLLATVKTPSRLLIVDNGSEPPVRAFLSGLRPSGAIKEIVVLQNDTNEGFPKGMNRGIAASQAPFVCLLNNDLEFTEGWLEELLEVARQSSSVGLVNPASNTFGQRPPAGVSLRAYAERLQARRGRYVEVGMCIGFCLLVKREVLERIGPLSEEVERIFFEDEDFSMRAQAAGFQCVVAEAAYVHHAEHRSVRQIHEREAIFQRNQRWCHERWGRWLRIAWPCFEPLEPGSPTLRRRLMQWQAWARRRCHLYVFSPAPHGVSREALFRSVGLVPHADVLWRRVPAGLAPWAAAGLILKRRKKPFDVIVAPTPQWGRRMAAWDRWHHAVVVSEDDSEALMAQWQRLRQFAGTDPFFTRTGSFAGPPDLAERHDEYLYGR